MFPKRAIAAFLVSWVCAWTFFPLFYINLFHLGTYNLVQFLQTISNHIAGLRSIIYHHQNGVDNYWVEGDSN